MSQVAATLASLDLDFLGHCIDDFQDCQGKRLS